MEDGLKVDKMDETADYDTRLEIDQDRKDNLKNLYSSAEALSPTDGGSYSIQLLADTESSTLDEEPKEITIQTPSTFTNQFQLVRTLADDVDLNDYEGNNLLHAASNKRFFNVPLQISKECLYIPNVYPGLRIHGKNHNHNPDPVPLKKNKQKSRCWAQFCTR